MGLSCQLNSTVGTLEGRLWNCCRILIPQWRLNFVPTFVYIFLAAGPLCRLFSCRENCNLAICGSVREMQSANERVREMSLVGRDA